MASCASMMTQYFFVYCDVPEAEIGRLRVGQDVKIRANAVIEHTYKGVIREIFLAAKDKKDWSRTGDRVEFEVRIEVLDKDDGLHPGMSSIVDIITATRVAVLSLPHEYIQRSDESEGKYFVTLENGEKRNVNVGLQNEEQVEIKGGLREGERVKRAEFLPPQAELTVGPEISEPQAASSSLLEVSAVHYGYRSAGQRTEVLKGVSFSISPGEFVGVLEDPAPENRRFFICGRHAQSRLRACPTFRNRLVRIKSR